MWGEERKTLLFLRDTSNILPHCVSPLLQVLPSCTQKEQVVNTFSELDKNQSQVFSTKSFLLFTLMATEAANLFGEML